MSIKRPNVSAASIAEGPSHLSRSGEELVMAFENWILDFEERCNTAGSVGQEPTEMDLGLEENKEERLSELAESHGKTRAQFIARIVNENLGRYGKPLLSQKRQS